MSNTPSQWNPNLSDFESKLRGYLDETKTRREEFGNYLAYCFDVLGVVSFHWNGLTFRVNLQEHKHEIEKQVSLLSDQQVNAIWKKGAEMFSK